MKLDIDQVRRRDSGRLEYPQVGAPHPHKSDAQRLLEQLVSERQRLVTDAEVLQEILHRYATIGRRDAIQPAFDALLGIVDQVFDYYAGGDRACQTDCPGTSTPVGARCRQSGHHGTARSRTDLEF